VKRRGFLIACAAVLAPLRARAQRPYRIGVIHFHGGTMSRELFGGRAFIAAMKEMGYAEGRDYLYDERFWRAQEEAPGLVGELVAQKVDVIVAAAPPSIVAAKARAGRIPIVMMYSAEPVAMGLVKSLSRPGGNITGLTWDHGFETSLKTLELLREALPRLRRVGLLWDGTDSVHPTYAQYFAKASPQIGLTLSSVELRQAADIESAFARLRRERAEALVVLPSGQITIPHMRQIVGRAAAERLALLVNIVAREYGDVLMYYGPHLQNMPRRAAVQVVRILKGADPSEIPVEQPDKYDLVVDIGVARRLGILVPDSLLVRADKVIQ
jgi:putative ABC transport system substrate-binding protein